jgi:hypothetical protein
MKKCSFCLAVVLTFVLSVGCDGPPPEPAIDTEQDINAWLSYSIKPRELQTALRRSMWGNGQIELFADLNRPCVNIVVSFGFGPVGLRYGSRRGEQHLIPAIYDDETGKKYFPHSSLPSGAQDATVIFRPDRQTWRYEFDDLTVDVSLILPRLHPGYFYKLELIGNALLSREAGSSLKGGAAWCLSRPDWNGEAIGSTVDAESINLGMDYEWANDIMIKLVVEREGDRPSPIYLARAFGPGTTEAKETLAKLLSSPENLEREAEEWWDQYLNEVPFLDVPDESFAQTFLWSWANFRMNRIDLPVGKVPAGLSYSNFGGVKVYPTVGGFDEVELGAIHLMHESQYAKDLMLYYLQETRKEGLLSNAAGHYEYPGFYVCNLGYFCGLLHKYLLTSGDLGLLAEPIDGITFLERLEGALEAMLPYRDEKTGLYWTDGEMKRFPGFYPGELGGMGPCIECVTRFRGARGSFYNDSNAVIYGTFQALADIQELAQNPERSASYRQMAEDLRQSVQKHLWDDELGFFRDRLADGTVSDYVGMGGFVTGLFANHVYRPGGLATPEQAERLAAWCNHPEFESEFGVLCLARSSPYFDPADWKCYNSNFDMIWTNQITAGLYAHGLYEEAHRQLFKLFRRLGENAGLGPRYRGECYDGDTGEIIPRRFVNYPGLLSAMSSVFEGVFGMRWNKDALTVHVNSPWPWAKLTKMRIRDSLLDLELTTEGILIAKIDGKEAARSAERKLELPWEMF